MTTSLKTFGAGLVYVAAACLALAGCGGKEAPAHNASAKSSTAAKTTASNETGNAATGSSAPSTAFLSVFSTNDMRDPFHPKMKPKAVANASSSNEPAPNEIENAVAAGFQGIFGSADNRMVLVHGVLLVVNREATIPVSLQGNTRRIKVKPVRILRNAAELQVEGLAQPITVPKSRR